MLPAKSVRKALEETAIGETLAGLADLGKPLWRRVSRFSNWRARQDSNLRPLAPEAGGQAFCRNRSLPLAAVIRGRDADFASVAVWSQPLTVGAFGENALELR